MATYLVSRIATVCHAIKSPLAFWLSIIQQLAVVVAAAVGGYWALHKIKKEREWDTALEIDVDTSVTPLEHGFLVYVVVILTNKGRVKLQAKPVDSKQVAFCDSAEKLQHSCTLQIKKLKNASVVSGSCVSWFSEDKFHSHQFPQIDLLDEYNNPDLGNKTEFWMEPGETYKLGTILALSEGTYLMKITFIGSEADTDFWSRTILMLVPPSPLETKPVG